MDDLGFDEAWFGEHHTSGYEIITAPDLMIMAAAARTRHMRLGTGVVSLAYHHPLVVANRIAQLDHLTRGRVLFGVGPGSLPSDAKMLGIPYTENRRRMEESMDVIMHLFTSDEPLTVETDWFKLHEGLLNFEPYQRPHPPVFVASVASPNAPRIAGKWGLPLLSLTGNNVQNFAIIREQFAILRQRAEEFGAPIAPRSEWRLTGPMHIAETREQAEREVAFGLEDWIKYFFRVPVDFFKLKDELGNEIEDATDIEVIRGTGFGVIGTPDDAIAHLERLQRETGGFGAYLLLAHSWANREATLKSHELIAHYVIPHFQGALKRRQSRWADMQATLGETFDQMRAGMDEAVERHNREYGGGAGLAEGRIAAVPDPI
ncbi:Limonene 1,2-monooxygenase [Capillimicrobium parvum]|uniref:Limonene 1,2-monooxygenase n=2 Tax=Capillimicrobium parvum TaxID=2884022 RepID=A0A9E7BYV5_9ACTN|nr:Limonene 1,2-monooxygenase [Capillimicrobium parvum]